MNLRTSALVAFACASLTSGASAGFHVMQIEELIGGVGGNTNAQAIQLRMRVGGQNIVSASRIRAWNASGGGPVLLLDMTTNVPNSSAGANILITSSAFNALMACR